MRTFYGKKLRDWVENEAYPEKLTLNEFQQHLLDANNGFWTEMVDHPGGKDQFIEEWYEQFACWNDIKTEE